MKERQRWRPEEDSLLLAYVRQFGAKEWNLISERMGRQLDRDPKSCLERWKNYLKPGIKKGSLTPDEQTLVISLQAKYGNKWKKIAAEVPGRTAKRLGKWWEVFKEKQQKQIEKSRKFHQDTSSCSASSAVSGGVGSPETAVQGKYDHILETFAEKYVQPQLLTYQSPPLLPPWIKMTTSSTASKSPPLSLTLSEPVPQNLDLPARILSGQEMGILVQYCKELEESRLNWALHKKEATWRLNRLEQQLASEKARKRMEIVEEIEAKIRRLREEENGFIGRIDFECREQLSAMQRDDEVKEANLMEALNNKHLKLGQIVHSLQGFTNVVTQDFL